MVTDTLWGKTETEANWSSAKTIKKRDMNMITPNQQTTSKNQQKKREEKHAIRNEWGIYKEHTWKCFSPAKTLLDIPFRWLTKLLCSSKISSLSTCL